MDHAPGLGGTQNNPLWTTSAPNVFSRQGVGDLRGGKVWSKWAAPPANRSGIVNSVGWCGAPRGWTTRPAWEEHKTTHFRQLPRPTCSADRVWETFAAARPLSCRGTSRRGAHSHDYWLADSHQTEALFRRALLFDVVADLGGVFFLSKSDCRPGSLPGAGHTVTTIGWQPESHPKYHRIALGEKC